MTSDNDTPDDAAENIEALWAEVRRSRTGMEAAAAALLYVSRGPAPVDPIPDLRSDLLFTLVDRVALLEDRLDQMGKHISTEHLTVTGPKGDGHIDFITGPEWAEVILMAGGNSDPTVLIHAGTDDSRSAHISFEDGTKDRAWVGFDSEPSNPEASQDDLKEWTDAPGKVVVYNTADKVAVLIDTSIEVMAPDGTPRVALCAGERFGTVRVATADVDEAPTVSLTAFAEDGGFREKRVTSGTAGVMVRAHDRDRVLLQTVEMDGETVGPALLFINTSDDCDDISAEVNGRDGVVIVGERAR